MTPLAVLIELLERVGARNGAAVLFTSEELSQWPVQAVAAMKTQKLLAKSRPAVSVVCPGCERECVMPVHTMPTGPRGSASFTVCDKRSDINRVPVPAALLTQWRCDAKTIAGFVAANLGLRYGERHPDDAGLLKIGVSRGTKRRQMLCLRVKGELTLVAAAHAVALAELVNYCDGKYSVDAALIRQLVDSAMSADPRYTPSNARREARKLNTQTIYESWRKVYRDLKKSRRNMSDVWYAQQIAKQDSAVGRTADTIRKHLKK